MSARDIWLKETRTLEDALQPRPPTIYAVEPLFAVPSLNILYGAPAAMKSLILADLAVCIAAGLDWLPPLPHNTSGAVKPFKTTQNTCLWLDFDNGAHRTANRLAAFARGHQATSAPLFYLSMPSAPFDANKPSAVSEMVDYVRNISAGFVCIDNLMTISGGKDENSPEIGQTLANLRFIAEKTESAVVLIHHARKANGFRGGLGDDLRGHSSIRGAVDLALLVEREEGTDSVKITATKTRDIAPEPFGALFTYTHGLGTYDLETAKFFGEQPSGVETTAEIEQAIFQALWDAGKPISQSELVKAVKNAGVQAGVNRIRNIAARMANSLKIKTQSGNRGAILYHL